MELEYIDFAEGWVYLRIQRNGYSLYKIKIDGSRLQPAWREANWNLHEVYGFYSNHYYFNGRVNVGFTYGGSHHYTLFRCYPDGKVVNLHGNGSLAGSIESLNVSGDYVYWANRRYNLKTYVEEEIDFEKLTIREVDV